MRPRGLAPVVGSAALLLVTLGGCASDDEPADDAPGGDDGRPPQSYCGLVSPSVVRSMWGHDEVRTEGDVWSRQGTITSRAQECSVENARNPNRGLRVVVDDKPGARPSDLPLAQGCERPPLPSGWGPASSCWSEGGYLELTAYGPEEGRFYVVDVYDRDTPQARERAARDAVRVVRDANRTLEDLGGNRTE